MNLDMTKLSKSAGGTSGGSNGVREDTLGEFLNTVFSYQSKEDIPNQLQTQANVQNLKQISRDTTAIIARYDRLDYVLQIDALVDDSSTRGFIHGYIYNPNIKDIILVTINTTNGVATFTFNTDSGGSSGGSSDVTSNIYEASTDFSNFLLATETGETELPTLIVNEINNIPYNATGIIVDATSMGVPLKLLFVITSIATTNDWSIPGFMGKLVLYNFQTKGLIMFGYDNGTYKCIVS